MAFRMMIGVLWLGQVVLGQSFVPYDSKNHFIWPPAQGPTWAVDGQTFADNVAIPYGVPVQRPFSWVSTFESVSIRMWQVGDSHSTSWVDLFKCLPNDQLNGTNTWYWNGTIGQLNLGVTNVVFLALYECNSSDPTFYSDYFNLTKGASGSSSTVSPIPTATPSGSISITPAASTPTSAATHDASNNVAVLAGGIGGGVGGAILFVVAAFVFWRHRKNKKQQQQQGQQMNLDQVLYSPGVAKYSPTVQTTPSTLYTDTTGSYTTYNPQAVYEMGPSHG